MRLRRGPVLYNCRHILSPGLLGLRSYRVKILLRGYQVPLSTSRFVRRVSRTSAEAELGRGFEVQCTDNTEAFTAKSITASVKSCSLIRTCCVTGPDPALS